MTEADEFFEKTAHNAEEPVVAVAPASTQQIQPRADIDLPSPEEELCKEIDEIEAHWDDPNQWVTSQQLWSEIKRLYPWANI